MAAENTRRRQRTLWFRVEGECIGWLVDSRKRSTETENTQSLFSRHLVRQLGKQRISYRKCSTETEDARSLDFLKSDASECEVGSGLQTQLSVWIAGERIDFSVDGTTFYPGKIADSVVFANARFCPLFAFLGILRGPF